MRYHNDSTIEVSSNIMDNFKWAIDNPKWIGNNPYGNGDAAKKIIKTLFN